VSCDSGVCADRQSPANDGVFRIRLKGSPAYKRMSARRAKRVEGANRGRVAPTRVARQAGRRDPLKSGEQGRSSPRDSIEALKLGIWGDGLVGAWQLVGGAPALIISHRTVTVPENRGRGIRACVMSTSVAPRRLWERSRDCFRPEHQAS
jgi:hypothetical protein